MDSLLRIIARLRAPGGCPWDRAQTHSSLKPYLLEETHELLEALQLGDPEKILEELGDVLLQILLHAQLMSEKKHFDFNDVARRLEAKLIHRHPHVFGNSKVRNLKELHVQWEALKNAERGRQNAEQKNSTSAYRAAHTPFKDVPKTFTALMRAQKVQSRVAKDGFDWKTSRGPLAKIREELHEVTSELNKPRQSRKHIEAELGDLLFSVVNLCRKWDISAETALRSANLRFENRYLRLLKYFKGKLPKSKSLVETAWKTVKTKYI